MAKISRVSTGSIWEKKFGYSRAVRIGNQIFISGTIAVDEKGEVIAPGDSYKQTRFIFKKIANTLEKMGASIKHVVRTRFFVTDINDVDEVGKAHNEFFRETRPASTLVEVSKLVQPDCTVEVEVDVIIPNQINVR